MAHINRVVKTYTISGTAFTVTDVILSPVGNLSANQTYFGEPINQDYSHVTIFNLGNTMDDNIAYSLETGTDNDPAYTTGEEDGVFLIEPGGIEEEQINYRRLRMFRVTNGDDVKVKVIFK